MHIMKNNFTDFSLALLLSNGAQFQIVFVKFEDKTLLLTMLKKPKGK